MASSVIPQDIIDSIIEAVGNDTRSLKRCALVSSEFLFPCRKRLFSRISFTTQQACQRLHRFLVENPVLQSFVKTVNITLGYHLPSYSLVPILRLSLCSLESFSIFTDISPRPTWNDFSTDLKDALSTIIHSPTLKIVRIVGIDVPIVLFKGVHLTKLELRSVSPRFDLGGGHSRLLAPASEEVAKTASHTVIDQLEWAIDGPVHGLPDPMFLPFTCHLRILNIYVDAYAPVISELDILTFLIRSLQVSSSSATLEHLEFGISFQTYDRNDYLVFFDDLHGADVWSHLDSIVTHPTGSRLQSVEIGITYRFHDFLNSHESQVVDPILNSLPLLREKGILSIEATNTYH